jgi:hypothetical protein
MARWRTSFLLYLSGDPSGARDAVSEALRDPQAQLRPYGYITALTTAALIAIDDGDSTNAEATARRALTYATTVGLSDNLGLRPCSRGASDER